MRSGCVNSQNLSRRSFGGVVALIDQITMISAHAG